MLLCVSKQIRAGLTRLLEAGGAFVVKAEPPFDVGIRATHLFIEAKAEASASVDIAALRATGIHCLEKEYIAEYLMQREHPKVTSDRFLFVPSIQRASSVKRESPLPPLDSKRLRHT